jgi:polyisoprenoid-binding protein YceI
MEVPAGTYTFGPENGSMWVKTERGGAAAVAGHDLVIQVTGWEVTLEVGTPESSLRGRVDSTSLRVREGFGGMQPLDDSDKANIDQTINDEVLEGTEIAYRSTAVQPSETGYRVEGELTLAGAVHPLALDISVANDGLLASTVVLKQTDWGMEPYSALFGVLKVADEIEITVKAALSSADRDLVDDAPEWSAPDVVYRQLRILDPGVSSFIWASVFFLFLWLGMLAVDVSSGTAVVLALLAATLIFVFVRTRGLGHDDGEDAQSR